MKNFLLLLIFVATFAGHPIGWNEWSAQGQSFQNSTTAGILLNAGRAGLGAGTLGLSEMVGALYQYAQDGDPDTFQQHMGSIAGGNLLAAGGARLTGNNPQLKLFKDTKVPADIRYCFLAGTLVSKYSEKEINKSELIPIEKISIGNKVWSFNFAINKWEVKPVLETFRTKYDGDIATINIGTDIIHATGGHPFWVISGDDLENRPLCDCLPESDQGMTTNGRWVYARDLQVDDTIRSRSLDTQKVTALESSTTETLVYNFLVDDLHNYTVGENEILVHNTNASTNGYMVRKSGLSGKEAANDVPSFAIGKPPKIGEIPTKYAERLMTERYGKDWRSTFNEKGKLIEGPKSEFNRIKKAWRGFE